MSADRTQKPYLVTPDGVVLERKSRIPVGTVALSTEHGWLGYDITGKHIDRPHWSGRKYAAQVVWEASAYYVPPTYYRHDEQGDTPGAPA